MAKLKFELNPINTKKILKWAWIGFGSFILLFGLLIILINYNVFGELPSTDKLENPEAAIASEVYSADGVLLGKFYNENRSPIQFNQLSQGLIDALTSTEDARFQSHSGIDFRGLTRAFLKPLTLQGSSGGGSTITQQLAKNLFGRPKFHNKFEILVQKLKEWVIAVRLESFYTKEEIMAMYFNTVDFGHNAYGIKSAAKTYFNKEPKELNTPESAMLVGMLQAPTKYSPIKNLEASKKRRNVVLAQMVKYGKIKKEQFERFKIESIDMEKFAAESHTSGQATYFREYIRQLVDKITREQGLDLYSDGLKIYTTLDSRLQKYAEEATYEHLKEMQKLLNKQYLHLTPWKNAPEIIDLTIKRSERYIGCKRAGMSDASIIRQFNTPRNMKVFSYEGPVNKFITPLDSIKYYKYFLQSGMMAMEPKTGHVKVWVGGIDFHFFKYDHVDPKAIRQVGSTFKPFVYATAIKERFSPCQEVLNEPVVFDKYNNWQPKNSDGIYGGKQSLKQGLAYSTNCITAWVMKQVGVEPVISLAHRMGIKKELPPYPALCLGVADLSIYEMVSAFNTFNNMGQYVAPTVVTRIEDKNGKVIQTFIPETNEALDEVSAYIMIQMLKGVTERGGTAHRLRFRYGLNQPMAGKTGTTQNQSDAWYMGLTPQLSCGVWVGCEDRSVHFNDMFNGQGASLALPIYALFMQKVYKDASLKFGSDDWKKPVDELPVTLDCNDYQKNDQESEEGSGLNAGGVN